MYERDGGGVELNPSLAGIAALLVSPSSYEVWPENMPAINLFATLATQWIFGANGPIGLNYIPLFSRMDRLKLSEQDYEWMFSDIRVIEAEALSIMNKKD